MAKKKNNTPLKQTDTADLLASDFLGEVDKFVNTPTGSGIYETCCSVF